MATPTTNRRFGISFSAGSLANGIVINSVSRSSNTESAEARNHLGQITDIAVYGSGEEITIDGLATADGVKAGDIIALDSKNYLVTSTSNNESNTAFETASVQARYAPSAFLWSAASAIVGDKWAASGAVYTEIES